MCDVSVLEEVKKLPNFCEMFKQTARYSLTTPFFRDKENKRYIWKPHEPQGLLLWTTLPHLWFYQACAITKQHILEVVNSQQTQVIYISLPSGPGSNSLYSVWFGRSPGSRCMLPALTGFVYHYHLLQHEVHNPGTSRMWLIWQLMTKSSNIM